ncbi:hypothetical protein NHH03_06870 [Stieleria sp. TO1_6]|uniref:hypothetical protein n=1 Tax=Stieleria tagensis TaxID=2956795 RepID=UPI00209B2985|nr:hypothetical protein [Stieleria tagensis]MCO8121453.1 hypothetical protein [Stieleria tagensis]
MNGLERFTNPIRDKIQACESQEETWKLGHEYARVVFKFEDLLGDMVELFGTLDRADQAFRDSVSKDPNSYCEEHDRTFRKLHREYHYVAESVEVTATSIESDYGSTPIENIDDFRECLRRTRLSAKEGYQLAAAEERESLQSEVSKLLNAK